MKEINFFKEYTRKINQIFNFSHQNLIVLNKTYEKILKIHKKK